MPEEDGLEVKTIRERLRTCSSDSGCDVGEDISHDRVARLMEKRLSKVIKQHFQNAKQSNEHEEFPSPWQDEMSRILDNIKDELILEIKDIKVSLFGLTLKDGSVRELDEEDDCQSCDSMDDFDLWKYCLKLGPEWQSEEPEELDLPLKSKKRSRVPDFGVTEAFWRISLDHGGSGSYAEEIQNLPSWDSPDIFLDHDDQFDDFEDSEDQDDHDCDDIESDFCDIHHPDSDRLFKTQPRRENICQEWKEAHMFGSSWVEEVDEGRHLESKWTLAELKNFIETLERVDIFEEKRDDGFPDVSDLDPWSKCEQTSLSWAEYVEFYEKPEPEKSFLWTDANIVKMIGGLESFDCGRETFLDHIERFEEVEDIFEKNLEIFKISAETNCYQENIWKESHKFGKDWNLVILESSGWNNGHIFGNLWSGHITEMEDNFRRQLKKQTRRRKPKFVGDIADTFWTICLREPGRKQNFLTTTLKNLPSWESPDLFLDGEQEVSVQSIVLSPTSDEDNYSGLQYLFENNLDEEEITSTTDTNIQITEKSKKRTFRESIRRLFRKKIFHDSAKKKRHKNYINVKLPSFLRFASRFTLNH